MITATTNLVYVVEGSNIQCLPIHKNYSQLYIRMQRSNYLFLLSKLDESVSLILRTSAMLYSLLY